MILKTQDKTKKRWAKTLSANNMKKVHTTIRLCPDLHEQIVKIAEKENRKVSNVIETALKQVIKIENDKERYLQTS